MRPGVGVFLLILCVAACSRAGDTPSNTTPGAAPPGETALPETPVDAVPMDATPAASTSTNTTPPNESPSHELFSALLHDYVHDSRVNYRDLCHDGRLQEYTEQLSRTKPDEIENGDDRFAFWINAYNAFTLQIVCDHYPIKSINDLHFGGLIVGSVLNKTVWDKKFIVIDGRELSLNDIEHKIIRATKQHDDVGFSPTCLDARCPRAHFALVCASTSCPSLRSEAYEGYTLDSQLTDQARVFFADPMRNRFDVEKKKAYISKILDWYADDFGRNDEERLEFVARFLPEELAARIRANPKEWRIGHTDYDWSLNE